MSLESMTNSVFLNELELVGLFSFFLAFQKFSFLVAEELDHSIEISHSMKLFEFRL